MAIFSFDNINTLDCENQDLENDVKINKFATLQFRELLKNDLDFFNLEVKS